METETNDFLSRNVQLLNTSNHISFWLPTNFCIWYRGSTV